MRAAVALPEEEEFPDWIAVHGKLWSHFVTTDVVQRCFRGWEIHLAVGFAIICAWFRSSFVCTVVDFFNRINLIYGAVCEFCTEASCPIMTGGPKYARLKYQFCFLSSPVTACPTSVPLVGMNIIGQMMYKRNQLRSRLLRYLYSLCCGEYVFQYSLFLLAISSFCRYLPIVIATFLVSHTLVPTRHPSLPHTFAPMHSPSTHTPFPHLIPNLPLLLMFSSLIALPHFSSSFMCSTLLVWWVGSRSKSMMRNSFLQHTVSGKIPLQQSTLIWCVLLMCMRERERDTKMHCWWY